MSAFRKHFRAKMLPGASFESSEIGTVGILAPEDHVLTHEDIEETRNERAELHDALDAIDDSHREQADVDATRSVVGAISNVSSAADTVPPAAAEAFVTTANMTIATGEQVLGTDIPRLENDDTGRVSQASMESLGSWFSTAGKAFADSAGKFFGRIALNFNRLNDSSKGLISRVNRVRGKVKGRKGEGGKPLDLPSKVACLLVLGDDFAHDPLEEVEEFSKISLELSKVTEAYHQRLDVVIKTKIIEALSNKTRSSDPFQSIDTHDLLKQIDHILSQQPKRLIGNERYEFVEGPYAKLLSVKLAEAGPLAEHLIVHVEKFESLTTEEVLAWTVVIETLITGQMKSLERITTQCSRSFDAIKSVLEKLNATDASNDENDYLELDDSVDKVELLRLESVMVSEIGRVCDKLAQYQSDLVERINAVLTLVEESVFQD